MRRCLVAVSLLFLVSCKQNMSTMADQPHATVALRDGSTVTGTVTASTPSEISLNLDNNAGARTIPMKQVSSIAYDDTSAPAQAAAPAAAPDAGHENHYHPAQAAMQTKTFVLPAGTEVRVRSEETIDSARAVEGQTFAAEVAGDVRDADGAVVIPRGANAQLMIKSASRGGRFRGASDLVVDLRTVAVAGQQYTLDTSDVAQKGRDGVGKNKRTAEFVGGGVAIGAIIGAIAGHGKGAAIGAGSGAGAGALTEVLTKGGAIKIPAETVMTFRLDQALQVVEAR